MKTRNLLLLIAISAAQQSIEPALRFSTVAEGCAKHKIEVSARRRSPNRRRPIPYPSTIAVAYCPVGDAG